MLKLKTNSGKTPLCIALQAGAKGLVKYILNVIENNSEKGGSDVIEALSEKVKSDGTIAL
jgi:hypothetical protein